MMIHLEMLYQLFINRNLQKKPAIIYGDGKQQKMFFLYDDDVIYCLIKLTLDKKINKEIVNIGPDEETVLQLIKVAKMVANETGFNGNPPIYVGKNKRGKIGATCNADKSRKDYWTIKLKQV